MLMNIRIAWRPACVCLYCACTGDCMLWNQRQLCPHFLQGAPATLSRRFTYAAHQVIHQQTGK